MNTLQKGFTLVELMIVVAIIGILAAVAIPSYQDYIARSQVTEAVTIISGLKIEFTSAFGTTGTCPVNGADGFEAATGYQGIYVEKVEFGGPLPSVAGSTCSLTATFKTTGVTPGISGKKLIVAMTVGPTGSSQWEMRQSITQGNISPEFLPSSLR